ncbi:hypothetical protein [Mucilaginibacter jinjuensis]|uniref:PH (Pleckstrin Homology) domain-containing protein n=1 Tax=Mucilaginibacter jinjuensis TaxID=1176721 RepID=A0ABY7TAM8_9SPHI|nr:hypothetical protein [Mucilaginibacter jinjuensis]WCT13560.1 hypothetical protein PQO05_06370 [Mucilaginibacter jinjuensis]
MNTSTTLLYTEKEYNVSRGSKILAYVFSVGLGVGAIACFYLASQKHTDSWYIWLGVGLLILAVSLYIDCARSKIIISNEKIIVTGFFKTKELLIKDIAGYKTDKNQIFIKPAAKGLPTLAVSGVTHYKDYELLLMWIHTHFKDLDKQEYNNQVAKILNSPDLGTSTKDRKAKLTQARKTCKLLNIAGAVLLIALLICPIYPILYKLTIPIAIGFPLLCIIILYVNIDIITLKDDDKTNAYPTLDTAFYTSGGGLLIRSLFDFKLMSYVDCLLPVTGFVVILSLIFFLICKSKNTFRFGAIAIFFVLIYSYGSCIEINCNFDNNSLQILYAKVMDKRTFSGKSTEYDLYLSQWGSQTGIQETRVSHALYDRVAKGQRINVYVKPGLLRIPWFFVSDY